MVYEWVKVELYGQNNDGNPIRYTCASGTAIAKGTLLALSDPRTVAAQTTNAQVCAGVAAMDKAANDNSTSIAVWTDGIFEARASGGAIAVGASITSGLGTNCVSGVALTTVSGAQIIGYALEAADAGGEVINVRLRL
jgi:hypothetical protein